MSLSLLGLSLMLATGQSRNSSAMQPSEIQSVMQFWSPSLPPCEVAFDDGFSVVTLPAKSEIGPAAFPFGSITKTFTAILTLKLAQMGKIGLNTKLSEFKFDIPGEDSISVEDLLTHRSALPDYFFGIDPAETASKEKSLAMIRNSARGATLPKGKFFYSNTNYFLLGLICSNRGGHALPDLYRQTLSKPLGLKCGPERLPSFDLDWYGGAGELAGSTTDLCLLGQAIGRQDPRILNSTSWGHFWTPQIAMSSSGEDKYGFGVIHANLSIFPTLSHAGTVPANHGIAPFASMLIVRKDKERAMTLACLQRKEWDAQSLNAIYGAFASLCATADLKHWISNFLTHLSSEQLFKMAQAGLIQSNLAALITPKLQSGLSQKVGKLETLQVESVLVTQDTVKVLGNLVGSRGSVKISGQFTTGGKLVGFGVQS